MQRHRSKGKITNQPMVEWKDLLTGTQKGPDVLIAPGRGYAVCFHRMLHHPSGSQIDSSDLSTKAKKKKLQKHIKKMKQKFKKLHLSSPRARATEKATPPTWVQIKKLTRSAKKAVILVEKTVTDENMCLAILAVLTTQAMLVTGGKYWACVPNPPILHSVVWGDSDIIEMTDWEGWKTFLIHT